MKTNKETTAMLKKCITILAFAIAAVMPAAPAAAWEQVCMKLPLWKSWYSGTFHVVYDFHTHLGVIPNSFYVSKTHSSTQLPDALGGSTDVRADGQIDSATLRVNNTKCVDISRIRNGDAFFVYIKPDVGNAAALCETHPSNPEKWYIQTSRPYRTLNYESWGGVAHPKCKFTHESN